MATHLLDCCGQDNLKKFCWDLDEKNKCRIGNACSFIGNKAAARKTRRRGTSGGKIEVYDEFGIEDCKSVSNSVEFEFECI